MNLTADAFITRLLAHQSDEELRKIQRYFKSGEGEYGHGDRFAGIRMGTIFSIAAEFSAMPIAEIDKLLESDIHEVRAGALSIMGKSASARRCPPERLAELYELYMRRRDRINNWDLVDLSAHHVVGGYLQSRPRDVLYELAASPNVWDRRIAMYATAHFVRRREVDDTFRLAELLVHDPEDLIQKVVGGLLRWAGDVDPPRLLAFLEHHGPTAPRTLLRYACEHLSAEERARILALGKSVPR